MRREKGFLLLGVSLMLVLSGCAEQSAGDIADKEGIVVREEVVEIPGLQEEFEFIFMADNHISLCDERDVEVQEKANARYESFRDKNGAGADENFCAMMDYVKAEEPELLVLGGDVVDSAMWASIDLVKAELEKAQIPWIYEMGNHDFEYGQEYFTQTAYTEYLPRLSDVSETVDGYQIREYDDFVVFAVDDSCNQIADTALEAFKGLVKEEKPIILITHVPIEPLMEDTLLEKSIEVWKAADNGNSRVLLGDNGCVPNETTEEFIELVMAEDSPVKLVLAGHIHFYHRDYLSGDLVQVVTGAGFERELVKVILVPED